MSTVDRHSRQREGIVHQFLPDEDPDNDIALRRPRPWARRCIRKPAVDGSRSGRNAGGVASDDAERRHAERTQPTLAVRRTATSEAGFGPEVRI